MDKQGDRRCPAQPVVLGPPTVLIRDRLLDLLVRLIELQELGLGLDVGHDDAVGIVPGDITSCEGRP